MLQKIANTCTKDLSGLERAEKDAITNLLAALDTAQLSKKSVLDAVNPRRELLGLPPLADLDANTSVKDGLTTTTASAPGRVPKVQAAADLSTLREALLALQADPVQTSMFNGRCERRGAPQGCREPQRTCRANLS